MSRVIIVAIKDKITGEFMTPMYVHNQEEAARLFPAYRHRRLNKTLVGRFIKRQQERDITTMQSAVARIVAQQH